MRGQLIAVEGTTAAAVSAGVLRVVETLGGAQGETACSVWDASAIFYELEHAGEKVPATPRTLVLLYAADLAFRLRWDIRPALEQGRSVIAAPYVETAVALGRAAALPRRWLRDLFRFAPDPDASYRVDERTAAPGPAAAGFFEVSSRLMGVDPARAPAADLRQRALAYLDGRTRLGRCSLVPGVRAARTSG